MEGLNDSDIRPEPGDDLNRDIGGDGTVDSGDSDQAGPDPTGGEDPNRDIGGDGTLDEA